VIEGVPAGDSGVIDLPLFKVSSAEEGWRMVVDPRGKAAVTRWEKLAVKAGRTMIRFFPETGRTHQIRAHALYGLGAGIVGDPVYGSGSKGPMLLHSHFLSLAREGKAPVEATAPLPERFSAAGFGPELLDA
jgi:tRNA pseudouridine32 synthase / 23S rRNA pseudouridine746 synthase